MDPVDLRYNLDQNLLVVSICFHESLYIGTLTLYCLTLILLMYYFKNLVICWVLWWTLLIPALLRVQFQDYIEKSRVLLSLPPPKEFRYLTSSDSNLLLLCQFLFFFFLFFGLRQSICV